MVKTGFLWVSILCYHYWSVKIVFSKYVSSDCDTYLSCHKTYQHMKVWTSANTNSSFKMRVKWKPKGFVFVLVGKCTVYTHTLVQIQNLDRGYNNRWLLGGRFNNTVFTPNISTLTAVQESYATLGFIPMRCIEIFFLRTGSCQRWTMGSSFAQAP